MLVKHAFTHSWPSESNRTSVYERDLFYGFRNGRCVMFGSSDDVKHDLVRRRTTTTS